MHWRLAVFLASILGPFNVSAAPEPVVLVAGATGATGQIIVAALQDQGVAVRGLVRDITKANDRFGASADWVVGDVRDPESLARAFAGVTHAISVIGSRERSGPNSFEFVDWEGNRNLIDAAKAARVARFVLMTSGSAGIGTVDDDMSRRFGAGRVWKGRAEAYLRTSGIAYTIVAPGGLRNYAGGEKDIILKPRRDYSIGVISRADVARVIVTCLFEEGCAGKTMTVINSDTAGTTWRQSLAEFPIDTPESVTGTYERLERSLP